MEEMVRSLRTLELIVRNPALIDEIDANLERHRRDVLPTDSEGGTDPNPNDGRAPYLGPYSYPMFSGTQFHRVRPFSLHYK